MPMLSIEFALCVSLLGSAFGESADAQTVCDAKVFTHFWRNWRFVGEFAIIFIALHCLAIFVFIKSFQAYFSCNNHMPAHDYTTYLQLRPDTDCDEFEAGKERPRASLIARDHDFLRDFSKKVLFLGIANFIPVFVFFGLTIYDPDHMVLAMIIAIFAKAVVGVVLQGLLAFRLQEFVGETNQGLTLYYSQTLCGLPFWIFTYPIALSDFADLDLDSANAAQSWRLPEDTLGTYCETWKSVPLIGKLANWFGLPGTLTAIAVIGILLQFYSFAWRMRRVLDREVESWSREDAQIEKRIDVWFDLQHACDAASLTLLGDRLNSLTKYAKARQLKQNLADFSGTDGKQIPYCHVGRSVSFWVRNLPEAVPSSWVAVSLLAISYEAASKFGLSLMIVSVVNTIFTIVKAGTQEFFGCAESVRVGNIFFGFGGSISLGAVSRLNIWLLTIYMCVACIVRFAGVWYCDSHILNLSDGCWLL